MFKDMDGVIFDMDGTIIDSMWVWKRVDYEFLESRNIEVPLDIQKQIEGLSFTETAHFFKSRFNLEEDIEEIKDQWLNMVKNYYESIIPLKKGAFEFISQLKKEGRKVGLATSNSRELTEIVLKRTGLMEYFDAIVTSCEIGKDKSCPDVFLKTAEDLNISPCRCLVFEDTAAGVTGAKRAGMRVIAVYDEFSLPYKDEITKLADKYIEGFEEIA